MWVWSFWNADSFGAARLCSFLELLCWRVEIFVGGREFGFQFYSEIKKVNEVGFGEGPLTGFAIVGKAYEEVESVFSDF